MHPWSKDCGCPFARVGTTSIRSSRGPKRPAGLKGPAPGSLSPKPSSRRQTLGRRTRSPPVKRGRRRGPSPGFPVWGPEPSRAQLLQGRAAPTQTVDSKLPLALGVCLQGSRQPPEKVPVSRLGKLSGAHAAGRTPFGQVRSCSRRTFQRAVPRDTSSQAGAPVWATSKRRGLT